MLNPAPASQHPPIRHNQPERLHRRVPHRFRNVRGGLLGHARIAVRLLRAAGRGDELPEGGRRDVRGRRPNGEPGPTVRDVRDQSAVAEPADLAQLAHEWAQAVRLCSGQVHGERGLLGVQARWGVAARAVAGGDGRDYEGRGAVFGAAAQ
uniref:(northern house mosquito) hypothetical protein n=1 Tax=Culex pipiens TaxID=7175 RepID=A0A8D8N7Y1_CULPI